MRERHTHKKREREREKQRQREREAERERETEREREGIQRECDQRQSLRVPTQDPFCCPVRSEHVHCLVRCVWAARLLILRAGHGAVRERDVVLWSEGAERDEGERVCVWRETHTKIVCRRDLCERERARPRETERRKRERERELQYHFPDMILTFSVPCPPPLKSRSIWSPALSSTRFALPILSKFTYVPFVLQ